MQFGDETETRMQDDIIVTVALDNNDVNMHSGVRPHPQISN